MTNVARLTLATAATLAAAYAMTSCGPACNPSNCKTCCDPRGYCVAQISDLSCGASGSLCITCPLPDSCLFGRCMSRDGVRPGGGTGGGASFDGNFGGGGGGGTTPICGPSNCIGCCSGNVCVFGNFDMNCGSNGALCQVCASGSSCVNGLCTRPDGGPLPCASQGRCTRSDGTCGDHCTTGCCIPGDNFGRCNQNRSDAFCGHSGNVCAPCDVGTTCVDRSNGTECQ